MKREVSKLEKPIHTFATEEWRTADPQEAAELVRALDHPVRRRILEILDEGPVRQAELLKLLKGAGRGGPDSASLIHHLRILEGAGLVAFQERQEGGERMKFVRRIRDVRIQVYERPATGAPG